MDKGISVDGANGEQIKSVEEMVGRFCIEMGGMVPGWLEQLMSSPGSMKEPEKTLHVDLLAERIATTIDCYGTRRA